MEFTTATIPDNQVKTIVFDAEKGEGLLACSKGFGMAFPKHEGTSVLTETGEDVTALKHQAERLFSTIPKSRQKGKAKFIENYILVAKGLL